MRKLLTIMWKDVNVLFRDGAAVILIIAGPLVLAVGMGLVTGSFNRSDDAPSISRIPVAVVDQDGGDFAAALAELLTGDDLGDLLAAQILVDAEAARTLVREGDAAAAVVIPPGFSASLLPDMTTGEMPEPIAVEVLGDAGSPIGAGVVRSIVAEFTARAQTAVTSLRISLGELAASEAVAPAELLDVGRALGEQLFAGGESMAASSLIALRRESASAEGSADFNPMAYFAPAMALLFLMYAVTLGARTLLAEKREGTLARMLAAPVTASQVLGGKVAGIFLGGAIQLGVLIVLTSLLFQLRWGDPLGVVLLVLAAAAAATGWGLLLASLATTSGQIASLGMALTLIFGILGGSFVPMQSAPSLMVALSYATPNRWALDGFTALALGEGLSGVATPLAALAVMAVTLFVLAAVVFRRRQSSLLAG